MSFDPYTGKPINPPTGEARPWWRRNLWPIVISTVLFFAGIALGASGGSSDKTAAETVTVTSGGGGPAPAQTVTVTENQTQTVTQAPASTQAPPAAAPKRHKYSGNGGKTLQIVVSRDGNLVWTNDGDIFQIFEDTGQVSVNSQSHRGTTFVSKGRYKIQVNAIGNWTITAP